MNEKVAEQLAQTCWDLRARIAADAKVEAFREGHLQQCEKMRDQYFAERDAARDEVKRLRGVIRSAYRKINTLVESDRKISWVELLDIAEEMKQKERNK